MVGRVHCFCRVFSSIRPGAGCVLDLARPAERIAQASLATVRELPVAVLVRRRDRAVWRRRNARAQTSIRDMVIAIGRAGRWIPLRTSVSTGEPGGGKQRDPADRCSQEVLRRRRCSPPIGHRPVVALKLHGDAGEYPRRVSDGDIPYPSYAAASGQMPASPHARTAGPALGGPPAGRRAPRGVLHRTRRGSPSREPDVLANLLSDRTLTPRPGDPAWSVSARYRPR